MKNDILLMSIRKQLPWLAIALLCFAGTSVYAGNLTTDNLTVNKDATLWGNVDIQPLTDACITNGLVLFFNFATNTTTVPDLSGNANTGVVSGATWTSEGWTNGAYSIDSTAEGISVPCTASLKLPKWTITCWLKCVSNTTTEAGIISRGYHLGNYRNYQLAIYQLKVSGWFEDQYGTDCDADWSDTISYGTWYHAAYTYDGTNSCLYMNGTLVSSHAQTITPRTDQNDNVLLWKYDDNWTLGGTIDETRIYNRALSGAEIRYLYHYYNPASSPVSDVTIQQGIKYIAPLGDLGMGTYTNQP